VSSTPAAGAAIPPGNTCKPPSPVGARDWTSCRCRRKGVNAYIHRKSNERANEGSCGVCATHIQNMEFTAGQGGITKQYAGRTVFHISSGRRGGDDGCSVFFTLSEQSKTAKGLHIGAPEPARFFVAGIVAVGWHAGETDTIYQLDWGKGAPFFSKARMDSTT